MKLCLWTATVLFAFSYSSPAISQTATDKTQTVATTGNASAASTAQNPSTQDPNAGSPTTPPVTPSGDPTASAPVPSQDPIPTTNKGDGAADNPSTDTAAKTGKQPVQAADPDKVKHNGGKSDVDAIGNRKMGARGLGDWYSLETEIRMGKQYSMQVESTAKLVTDPVVTEYVNRIGQNLVRNSDSQVPFTIKVIDADEINAFALPGGFFYVNSGLILAADEEAELAGVMAHEIAHVAARHATRQMTRSNLAQIGTIPLIFVGGGIGYAVRGMASLAMPMTFLAFSRTFESEADYLGLQYMYKTGYDPQAFVNFFEKVQAQEKKKPGTLSKAFATHPQTPDRIAKSQEEIATILPAREQYLVTTSEFDDVKARLAALENRRKMIDPKDGNKPTLRKTSASSKDSKTDNGDDHPTLKRRTDDSN